MLGEKVKNQDEKEHGTQSDLSIFLSFGSHYLRLNNIEKARSIFEKCLEKDPSDFRGYYNLGTIYSTNQINFPKAIEYFEKVHELNPNVIEVYGAMSSCLIKMKLPESAIMWCQKGLQIDQNEHSCKMNLIVALRQLDKLTEALLFTRNNLPNVSPLPTYHLTCEEWTAMSHQNSPPAEVTFVMLKWGTKYSAVYINNLVQALLRYTSHLTDQYSFKIICFTDNITDVDLTRDGNIQYRSLPDVLFSNGWSGWWYKAYLFSSEAELSGTVIYLDLDTVICSSSFTSLITQLSPPSILSTNLSQVESNNTDTTGSFVPSPHSYYFACLGAHSLTNEGRPCGINSSVMIWNASKPSSSLGSKINALSLLYEQLLASYQDITKEMYKFDHYLEYMLYPIHNTHLNSPPHTLLFLQNIFPHLFVDFHQATKILEEEERDGNGNTTPGYLFHDHSISVICFPLSPKPHEVCDDTPWVKKWWFGEEEIES